MARGHYATPRGALLRPDVRPSLPRVPSPANSNSRPRWRPSVVSPSVIPSVARRVASAPQTARAVRSGLMFLAGYNPALRGPRAVAQLLGLLADWAPEIADAFGFDPSRLWELFPELVPSSAEDVIPVNLPLGELAPVGGSWTLSASCASAGPPTHGRYQTRTISVVNSAIVNSVNNCLSSQHIGEPTFIELATGVTGTQSNNITMATYTHGTLPNIYGTWSRYWTRPASDIGTPYQLYPEPVPRAWPRPLPRYRPVPEVPLVTAGKPGKRPDLALVTGKGRKTRVVIQGSQKPRPGTKENKTTAKAAVGALLYGIYRVADGVGELREVIQAIYDAHPDSPRTRNPIKVINWLFGEGHIREMALSTIVTAIIGNEIEDRIIGRLNRLGDTRNLGGTVNSFSSVPRTDLWVY